MATEPAELPKKSLVPTPRILIWRLAVFCVERFRFGASLVMSEARVTRRFLISSPVYACSAMGTSCTDSSRFWAVTIISSRV